MARIRHIAISFGVALAGCTFSGLADYEVSSCEPGENLDKDTCNGLNQGNTSCQRYQCNPETRRCVLSTLDFDKDGDPPIECGGTDCDDREKKRSGKAKEVCDGIDNDCDGVSDNALLAVSASPVSSAPLTDRRTRGADARLSAADGRDGYTTYLGEGASCVRGFPLGGQPGDAGCTLVDTSDAGTPLTIADAAAGDAAREPTLVRHAELGAVGLDNTSVVAFIEEHPRSTCEKEQLAFWSRARNVTSLGDCGAALPSLVAFPQLLEALIAFYDVRTIDRKDPIDGCAAAKPAPLKLRWVDRPTADPDLTTSPAITLGNATATRPPALFPVRTETYVLLASPLDASVGVWQLTPDGRVIPLALTIPALDGARAVAVSVGSDGATTRLAIVAERGCKPNQSLTMVVATFDPSNATFPVSLADPSKNPFKEIQLVQGPAAVATAPSIAWIPRRNEWWVTWIDERQKAVLRRVSRDGATADAPLDLGDASLATLRAQGEITGVDGGTLPPSAFLLRRDESAIDELTLSCKGP